MGRLRAKLSYSNVIATIAMFVALGGVAVAAGKPIMTGDPAGGDLSGTYPNPAIRAGSVTSDKLAPTARVVTSDVVRLASGENRTLLDVDGVQFRAFCFGDAGATTAHLEFGGARNIMFGIEGLNRGQQRGPSGGGFQTLGEGISAGLSVDSGWFNIVTDDGDPPVALNGSFLVRGLAGTLKPCIFEIAAIQQTGLPFP